MVYLEYIVLYFRGASFSLRDRKKVQYVSEVIHPHHSLFFKLAPNTPR